MLQWIFCKRKRTKEASNISFMRGKGHVAMLTKGLASEDEMLRGPDDRLRQPMASEVMETEVACAGLR